MVPFEQISTLNTIYSTNIQLKKHLTKPVIYYLTPAGGH